MTDLPPEVDDHSHAYADGMHIPVVGFDYTSFDVEPEFVRREQRLARYEHRLTEFVRGLLAYLRSGAETGPGYRLRMLVIQWHFDGTVSHILGAEWARMHGMKKQLFQREVMRFRKRFNHRDMRYYSRKASVSAEAREAKKREQTAGGARRDPTPAKESF